MILGDLAVWTIRGYQKLISAHLPPMCRFYPSCSAYAVEAIRVHGPVRGGWLATHRILRCHPFNPGGIDPVPPAPGSHPGEPPASDAPADATCGAPPESQLPDGVNGG